MDRMNDVIGHEQGTIVRNVKAMGEVAKVSLAEGAEVVALAVEHDERLLGPREHVDVVLRINGHTGAFMERDARRQRTPALDILITKVADSVHVTHDSPPYTPGSTFTVWCG